MDLFDAVLRPWTVGGCIVGMLLAAGLRWMVPEVPLLVLALVVAVGALVGVALDHSPHRRR
jgi:di/tricarboxylate transporter